MGPGSRETTMVEKQALWGECGDFVIPENLAVGIAKDVGDAGDASQTQLSFYMETRSF